MFDWLLAPTASQCQDEKTGHEQQLAVALNEESRS